MLVYQDSYFISGLLVVVGFTLPTDFISIRIYCRGEYVYSQQIKRLVIYFDINSADEVKYKSGMWDVEVPSGCLTVIARAQKWGFSCKVQRRPPADIFLDESLPPKTPLRTPDSWPPWPWFSREKLLKIFKVLWNIRNFNPHFKNLYLARKWVQRAHFGLVWKLVQGLHLLFYSIFGQIIYWNTAKLYERAPKNKTFKWPWKVKVLSTSSKFCLCASRKTRGLQILGNA